MLRDLGRILATLRLGVETKTDLPASEESGALVEPLATYKKKIRINSLNQLIESTQ